MSCSFSTVDSVCGPPPYAPSEPHVISLKSCRKDLTHYLTNLGVSGSRGFGTRINEADVILNRAGLHSLSEENKERITDEVENTGKEGSDLTKKESPVNECSGFNSTALAFEDNINLSYPASSEFECALNSTVTHLKEEDEEISFWVDKQQHQQEKRAVLNEALAHISDERVSPIASTLNSNRESISSTQKVYYLRKVGQVLKEVLTTIAPDQEEKVLEALKHSLDTTLAKKGNKSRACAVREEVTTNQLPILLRVCHEAENRQTRLQNLSMFAKRFSKKELREMIPGLSKWQIDQARRHAAEEGPGQPVVSEPIKRTRLDPGKEAKAIRKEAKRYLKTDFKSHVGPEERCVDHCTGFSLSDPHNDAFAQCCNHIHDMSCSSCSQLDEVLSNVMSMINSPKLTLTDEEQSQVTFDVAHAVEAITSWKAHMLRTVNQEQAKEETLGALNYQSVLVIMDWAMKYLPQRCIQDWFSVASIVEHILVTIKQEHPSVEMAYLKSDNAGCYHNASLILSLKSIGEGAGITMQRYDFSDPQSGKDVCDRKIAPMKGHIQRWVNEKHDIVTAVDMKEALESYGGVRGCRITVAEVDVAKAAKPEEWKGISALFNFEFLSSGIRAWKAYGVGEGQMFPYDEVQNTNFVR
ncbi:hypothetical protein AWC38_SpisGene23309 [Stylophora pistillata]|uniref:Uncharacterized protein n=1 Tax=Stylophora pistillata TaxID=50429 RepID=A0A2B4R793_STYPI|nr:hypothetical protein AWC38_SpisGene23309 [Stylophora pistillata]